MFPAAPVLHIPRAAAVSFGRSKKLEAAVKNEQRQQAECDRLATDAAADLRPPGEERDKQDGLSAQPAPGSFSFF
jgi:hypothetical protein